MRFDTWNSAECISRVVDGDSPRDKTDYAMRWLCWWLRYQRRLGKHGCVVFDIDDTLIDSETNKRIESVCRVFDVAQSLGFPRVIVTARPDLPDSRRETTKQLRELELTNYDALYMMPFRAFKSGKIEAVSRYKRRARNDIVSEHYPILANVDDMLYNCTTYPYENDALNCIAPTDTVVLFPSNAHGEAAVKVCSPYSS